MTESTDWAAWLTDPTERLEAHRPPLSVIDSMADNGWTAPRDMLLQDIGKRSVLDRPGQVPAHRIVEKAETALRYCPQQVAEHEAMLARADIPIPTVMRRTADMLDQGRDIGVVASLDQLVPLLQEVAGPAHHLRHYLVDVVGYHMRPIELGDTYDTIINELRLAAKRWEQDVIRRGEAITLQELAEQQDVSYSRVRHWSTDSDFPAPIEADRRPYLYDGNQVDRWITMRPGQGRRLDLS